MNGMVKKIVREKGFGFITADNGREFFFHYKKLKGGLNINTMQEGDRVSFEDAEGPKGDYAEDIYPES